MPPDIPLNPVQAPTVSALESGAATGEPGPLKRIDTHMSHLFLGRDHAYKLKRALRHPFADLSTLEARRRLCEAELEVNRPLAPGLYEAVLPVVGMADGSIRVGGSGPPLDYVVRMKRFEDRALLSEMADDGRLDAGLVERTAQRVAAFHRTLPPHPETGRPPDYHRIIEGLGQTEAEAAQAMGLESASEPLLSRLEQELARRGPLIEARRKAGKVVRGHGDLHLRNICLYRGEPTPFDALEFDPALATGDLLYDVAFLFMDLRARGLDALANRAMNAYWDAAGEGEDTLALLPLFTAMRAAIRMAVSVEARDLAQAARYRALAHALLRPPEPLLMAIGGLSGTGKTTLARAVAPGLGGPCGARILRTDVIRKHGPSPADPYAPQARTDVYARMAEHARAALDADATVIADATFQDEAQRDAIEQVAEGRPFVGVWLKGSMEVRLSRVADRHGDASDAGPAVAASQTEPTELGPAWRVFDADQPTEALAEAVEGRAGRR